jgi:predicted MFS family arabinose efflux permease
MCVPSSELLQAVQYYQVYHINASHLLDVLCVCVCVCGGEFTPSTYVEYFL